MVGIYGAPLLQVGEMAHENENDLGWRLIEFDDIKWNKTPN